MSATSALGGFTNKRFMLTTWETPRKKKSVFEYYLVPSSRWEPASLKVYYK